MVRSFNWYLPESDAASLHCVGTLVGLPGSSRMPHAQMMRAPLITLATIGMSALALPASACTLARRSVGPILGKPVPTGVPLVRGQYTDARGTLHFRSSRTEITAFDTCWRLFFSFWSKRSSTRHTRPTPPGRVAHVPGKPMIDMQFFPVAAGSQSLGAFEPKSEPRPNRSRKPPWPSIATHSAAAVSLMTTSTSR